MSRRNFKNFEITKREVLASVSIIAIMILIGILISGKISNYQMDKNEVYNKAVKIKETNLFQHGMDTNIGNAFVYGDLKAVDTVSYPKIKGNYIYVTEIEERYERHEKWTTVKDSNGKEHRERKVWYEWNTENTDYKLAKKINFCGVNFPTSKINLPTEQYIDTIDGSRVWSWKSGEYVKSRFKYYGVSTKYKGTIFTELKDKTISDNSTFYNNMNIGETVETLESSHGEIIFWILWIILTAFCVFKFYYFDNDWLE